MGPEFRHYRLIRLGTPVNREEPPACPLPDLITAHLLTMLTVSRPTTPRQFGSHLEGKRAIVRCERQLETQSASVITHPPSIVVERMDVLWKLMQRNGKKVKEAT